MTHKMIVHDAKEFAGVFYEQSRSAKFRATWPSQDSYVRANWQHFVVHVRSVYAQMLGRADVPQKQKDLIYDALIADAAGAHAPDAELPLQLAPDTQAFVGDSKENALIDDAYGKAAAARPVKDMLPIARKLLMGSTRIN